MLLSSSNLWPNYGRIIGENYTAALSVCHCRAQVCDQQSRIIHVGLKYVFNFVNLSLKIIWPHSTPREVDI